MLEKSLTEIVEVANIWSFQNRIVFNFVFIFQGMNHVTYNFKRYSIYVVSSGDPFELECPVKYCSNRPTVTWCKAKGNTVYNLGTDFRASWVRKKGRVFQILFCILIKCLLVTMGHTAVLWTLRLDSLKATQLPLMWQVSSRHQDYLMFFSSVSRKGGLRFSSDYVRHWTHVRHQKAATSHSLWCVVTYMCLCFGVRQKRVEKNIIKVIVLAFRGYKIYLISPKFDHWNMEKITK